jgi:hypothetical protein
VTGCGAQRLATVAAHHFIKVLDVEGKSIKYGHAKEIHVRRSGYSNICILT